MKSKPSPKTISYNTDEATRKRVWIAARARGVSVAEIVRQAIDEFADSLEAPNRDRSKGATAILDQSGVEKVKAAAEKTGMKPSSVIHECLAIYVMAHKEEIKNAMQKQVEEANRMLAA